MNDYYATLGVSRTASSDEIKRAYRKLVRELHPDVAGEGNEDRIKDVNQAYDVLSSPDKRQAYDMGADPYGGNGGNAGFNGQGFGFSDLFETFFAAAGAGGGRPAGPVPRKRPGQDALVVEQVDLADVVFGGHHQIQINTATVCTTCDGSCCQPGTSPTTCTVCGGSGVVQRTARSFLGNIVTSAPCSACQGFGDIIAHPCPDCAGEGRVRTRRTVEVDIPAGIDSGTRIRMPGSGEVGPAGGPAGDLYIEIRVKKHPEFMRDGNDLHCNLSIPMTAAALGASLTIDTLDGPQEIQVKPGSQYGDLVTLKGLGAGVFRSHNRGNLIVHLGVEVPTKLDETQRGLLAQLAASRGEEKPSASLTPNHSGFFANLFDKLTGR